MKKSFIDEESDFRRVGIIIQNIVHILRIIRDALIFNLEFGL